MPTVHSNGAEIYYEVQGQGQPFLFCSETAASGEIWRIFQVPEFAKDHQVITFDYRGTGRSGRPTSDYSTRVFCDDAVAVLDAVKAEQAIVLGHSMGGRVAQLIALEYPTRVKRLILASSGASFPGQPGLPLLMCQQMIEWGYEKYVRQHTLEVGFTEEMQQKYPEQIAEFFRRRLENLGSVEFYLRHVLGRQAHDTSARLKDIKMPTLVLVGEDEGDPKSAMSHRTSSDILAKGIPNAKFIMLPKQKHNYFFVEPEAAHRAIREFLQQ